MISTSIFSPAKFFRQWLKKRFPRKSVHTLRHRNIFILPTRAGLCFVVLIVLLWLIGTNYQNNLVLAVAFLLLAVMIVCIHHTYGNLAGLEISFIRTHPSFIGKSAQIDLKIKRLHTRQHDAVILQWPGGNPVSVALLKDDQSQISIFVAVTHRGWFKLPRLQVRTTYPLGLFRAWSNLNLDAVVLVYPTPIDGAVHPDTQTLDSADDKHRQTQMSGHEEFAGLRKYYAGDTIGRIDWRALARGQGLATKVYEGNTSQFLWFDWQQFAGMPREARLSRLCAGVLQQKNGASEYGLHLPGIEIQPAKGERHQQKILETLALFEWKNAKGE
ncbi:MAG: hypothetical protein ACJA04_000385 [Cellvibrionaceae bacterium]